MINRQKELKFVIKKFGEKGAQFVILWGRRRVGKTYLIKEFCSQYPAVYFLATKSSKKEQLAQFSETIAEFFNDSLLMIDHIWLREVKKKTSAFTKKKDIWIRSKDKIIHVKYYNPARQTAFGLTVNYFNPDFKLVKRIDAEKGEQKGDGWLLSGVMQQTVDTAGDNHRVAFREAMAISLDLSRDSLQRMVKKSEEMRFFELLKYIRDIETDGYDAVPYRVDLQAKIAFPFVCIIMCLAGAGIVIRKTSGQGIATGIAWGISIAFLYWIFYSFCVSLGYGGILPPLVSVWLANFVFLCLGIVVVQKNV